MSDTYTAIKLVHIAGAVLLLGNIIVTAWWKLMADRTGSAPIIAFAQRQVTLTDFAFTAVGVILLVVAGDTLSKIAKREYGDASKWHRIYEANKDTIKNPDLIYPGQTFKIPNA